MTDHPVLIPTSEGPVGGVVSEPAGPACAALLLLGGYGRPARSGVNSFWTRLARELAERGLLVLRADYSREGETLPIGLGGSGLAWKRALDVRLMTEVALWLRAEAGCLPALLAGSCSGARVAIEIAGRDPRAFTGTFLLVPYLHDIESVDRRQQRVNAGELSPADAAPRDSEAVDPFVVECFRRILARGPSWILVGDEDDPDIPRLESLLGPTPHELEVEAVPGVALHLLDRPDLQKHARSRLLARIERSLG